MNRVLILLLALAPAALSAAALGNIKVDQVGYLTWTPKVAVLARPMVGQGSPSSFDPGSSFEIRRVSDNGTAFSGVPAVFAAGATHAQSGDKGWWADFSALTTPGDYYLYLAGGSNPGAQSYPFSLGPDIYNAALAASGKSYYYQRCGTAIDAAHGGVWTHAACHMATELAAHLYDGSDQGPGTARDITGGWHDAGDYRKYVSFTTEPLWDLLHSWEWYPCGYGDATGIPESGNGVPDILDEVKWELDWLLKMQISGGPNDGALYSGAFVTGGAGGTGDPSTETATYYYANYSSAATAVGAFAFALGARLLGTQPAYAAYAATLQAASLRAWTWLQAHTANVTYNHTGFNNANANRSNNEDTALRLLAAAELFALTGGSAYQAYFDANYNSAALTDGSHNPILSNYFETGASLTTERALVSYALAPGATAAVVAAIRTSAKNGANNGPVNNYLSDLYRSHMWDGHYSWGSNQAKATWGLVCLWAVKIGANPASNATWMNVASEYLHYFFGRNALGWSFTTQSQLVGADQPVTTLFHSWFGDGTAWDTNPAPGILVGGPNQSYVTDVGYSGGTPAYPPAGEPIQKSYRDWNTVWPDCSWTVTENGIYYQAKYQFLLSAFSGCTAPPGTPTPTATLTPYAGTPTPTDTATATATPSATLTPVCQTLLNGAESLGENGAWSGGNALRGIVAAGSAPAGAVTQGGSALYVNITATAAWNDGFANLAGFSPQDWSPYTQLKMDVHAAGALVAGATYTELLLRADCSSCAAGAGLWYQPISADTPNLAAGPQTVTWNLDFTQGTIPPGSPLSKLTLVYNTNASAPAGALYIDNIRLIGACSAPTATRTPSPTPSGTPSRTASPSRTPSASPSASPTSTSTATTGTSPTATPSRSASPSASSSPSRTPTATPTATWTLTSYATPSPVTAAIPGLWSLQQPYPVASSLVDMQFDGNWLYTIDTGMDAGGAVFNRIQKLDKATAAPDPGFGDGIQVEVPGGAEKFTLNSLAVAGASVYLGYQSPVGVTWTATMMVEKRLASTGALDPSFGTGGVLLVNSRNISRVQVDGGALWLTGADGPSADTHGFLEKRSLADGSLDPAFNGGSRFTYDPSAGGDALTSVLADGADLYVTADNLNYSGNLLKLDAATGVQDMGFGGAGVAAVAGTYYWKLVADDAGALFVLGMDYPVPLDGEAVVLRLRKSDGSLDAGWGTAGVVRHNPGPGNDWFQKAVPDGNGGLLIAGYHALGLSDFQWDVTRVDLAAGAVDAAFYGAGTWTLNPGAYPDAAAAIQVDGSVAYVGGFQYTASNYQDRIETLLMPWAPTPTATSSRSASPTSSPSVTASPSASPTGTPSPSASPSPTGSSTASRTPTLTVTPSHTDGPSPTASATPSATGTATLAVTVTPSRTATSGLTPSPTVTSTWTSVVGATATASPSATLTSSPAATASPPAGGGELIIETVAACPNPDPQAIVLTLRGPADSVQVRVYTPAWVAAVDWQGGPFAAGYARMALPRDWNAGLAAGLYYIQVRAKRGMAVSDAVTSKLYLLR